MAKEIGVIAKLSGTVEIINAQGRKHIAVEGEKLHEGDRIVTAQGASVTILDDLGVPLQIGQSQTVALDNNVLHSDSRPTASDSAVQTTTADTVIQALDRGQDLSTTLDATAAGGADGGSGGGNTFVQLGRILEGVTGNQYAYGYDPLGIPNVPQGIAAVPTEAPTTAPTTAPTEAPTEAPTTAPTTAPTEAPTEAPTTAPTEAPTTAPTEAPTTAPTEAPTEAPTTAPTEAPTEAPTTAPTEAPTEAPTTAPTEAPTEAPTTAPTEAPTEAPTTAPTEAPTDSHTDEHTDGHTDDSENWFISHQGNKSDQAYTLHEDDKETFNVQFQDREGSHIGVIGADGHVDVKIHLTGDALNMLDVLDVNPSNEFAAKWEITGDMLDVHLTNISGKDANLQGNPFDVSFKVSNDGVAGTNAKLGFDIASATIGGVWETNDQANFIIKDMIDKNGSNHH